MTEPERLERELAAAPPTTRTVLIDDVQRVPALLDAVQAVSDARPRRFRFLLSVSSARKLRRGHANLLPGRVLVEHLHPLLACEFGDDFLVDRVLAQGSLPGISAEPDPALRAQDLRSYTDVYLREEIQAEALVRDIGAFARLLDLVAACSGRVINLHALSKDAGVSYETARRYLDVLEDTLVLSRVPAWSGADRTSQLTHPITPNLGEEGAAEPWLLVLVIADCVVQLGFRQLVERREHRSHPSLSISKHVLSRSRRERTGCNGLGTSLRFLGPQSSVLVRGQVVETLEQSTGQPGAGLGVELQRRRLQLFDAHGRNWSRSLWSRAWPRPMQKVAIRQSIPTRQSADAVGRSARRPPSATGWIPAVTER